MYTPEVSGRQQFLKGVLYPVNIKQSHVDQVWRYHVSFLSVTMECVKSKHVTLHFDITVMLVMGFPGVGLSPPEFFFEFINAHRWVCMHDVCVLISVICLDNFLSNTWNLACGNWWELCVPVGPFISVGTVFSLPKKVRELSSRVFPRWN